MRKSTTFRDTLYHVISTSTERIRSLCQCPSCIHGPAPPPCHLSAIHVYVCVQQEYSICDTQEIAIVLLTTIRNAALFSQQSTARASVMCVYRGDRANRCVCVCWTPITPLCCYKSSLPACCPCPSFANAVYLSAGIISSLCISPCNDSLSLTLTKAPYHYLLSSRSVRSDLSSFLALRGTDSLLSLG